MTKIQHKKFQTYCSNEVSIWNKNNLLEKTDVYHLSKYWQVPPNVDEKIQDKCLLFEWNRDTFWQPILIHYSYLPGKSSSSIRDSMVIWQKFSVIILHFFHDFLHFGSKLTLLHIEESWCVVERTGDEV